MVDQLGQGLDGIVLPVESAHCWGRTPLSVPAANSPRVRQGAFTGVTKQFGALLVSLSSLLIVVSVDL